METVAHLLDSDLPIFTYQRWDLHPKTGVEHWDTNHRHVECIILQTRTGVTTDMRMS